MGAQSCACTGSGWVVDTPRFVCSDHPVDLADHVCRFPTLPHTPLPPQVFSISLCISAHECRVTLADKCSLSCLLLWISLQVFFISLFLDTFAYRCRVSLADHVPPFPCLLLWISPQVFFISLFLAIFAYKKQQSWHWVAVGLLVDFCLRFYVSSWPASQWLLDLGNSCLLILLGGGGRLPARRLLP